MLPKEGTMPPGLPIVVGLTWLLLMAGMFVGYVIMLIAWWRTMKAHEKIANKLSEIAEKLQLK